MKDYKIVKENGKYFMYSNVFGIKGKAMIYKVNTNKPYVRYAGFFAELDDKMKKELMSIA